MCSGGDAVKAVANPFVALAGGTTKAVLGAVLPKPPDMPQVVREDPAAQQTKIESDAAQAAQAKTLDQRRRARANSLLSKAGGLGDPSTATVATPSVTGKPNLGG